MNIIDKYLIQEKGMPKGWTKDSISKFTKTIGKSPNDKGFFSACVNQMSKHIDDKQTINGL